MKKRLPKTKNEKRLHLRDLDKDQLKPVTGGQDMDPYGRWPG